MDNYIRLNYNGHIYILEKTYEEVSQYSSFIAAIPVAESQLGGNLNDLLQQPIDVNYIKPEEVLPLKSYINNPSRDNYKLLTEDLIMVFGFTPSPTALWLADDFKTSDRFLRKYEQLLVWDMSPMDQKLNNLVAFINHYGIKIVIIDDCGNNTHFNRFMKPLEKMIPNVIIMHNSKICFGTIYNNALYVMFNLVWVEYTSATYTSNATILTYCFHMYIKDTYSPIAKLANELILGSDAIDDLSLTKEVRLSSWMRDMINDNIIYTVDTSSILYPIPTIRSLNDTVMRIIAIEKHDITNIINSSLHNATIITDSELDVTQITEGYATLTDITIDSFNTATTIEELNTSRGSGNFLAINSDNNIKDSFVFIMTNVSNAQHYQDVLNGYYRIESLIFYYTTEE